MDKNNNFEIREKVPGEKGDGEKGDVSESARL